MTGKKCAKKPDARAELLFCQPKPVAFFADLDDVAVVVLLIKLPNGSKSSSSLRLRKNNEGMYTAAPNLRLRASDRVGVELYYGIVLANKFWPSLVLRNLVKAEKEENASHVPRPTMQFDTTSTQSPARP